LNLPKEAPDNKSFAGSHHDRIELLPVSLLDENREKVAELKKLAHSIGLEFGWHYLLDLIWILQNLDHIAGCKILDAGAGTGILQWFLSENGADVISVDRMSRASLPLRFRRRFNTYGLRNSDLMPNREAFWQGFKRSVCGSLCRRWIKKILIQARDLFGYIKNPRSSGHVWIYNQDLSELIDIQDDSMDAVVSLSALEHNAPDHLQKVVDELLRILKPGGKLLTTLTAAKNQDWWHSPSSGWCYSEHSIKSYFRMPPETPSNFNQYDQLLVELINCSELRNNLASFYFKSDNKGMPGGVWDPQYLPVGIQKTKS